MINREELAILLDQCLDEECERQTAQLRKVRITADSKDKLAAPAGRLLSRKDEMFLAEQGMGPFELRAYRDAQRAAYLAHLRRLKADATRFQAERARSGIDPHWIVQRDSIKLSILFGEMYVAAVLHRLRIGCSESLMLHALGNIEAIITRPQQSAPVIPIRP